MVIAKIIQKLEKIYLEIWKRQCFDCAEKFTVLKVYLVPGNIENIEPVCGIFDSKEHIRQDVEKISFGKASRRMKIEA